MNAYTELNIKYGMPAATDAMNCLKNSLERLRQNKYKCILIVHGYGSTGRGGAIRDLARQWLKAQERKGKIKLIIYGEDFNIFNFKALE